MDERIRHALASGRTIDITTIGRRSGEPKRVEIWFHNIDGKIYITGTPGKRDWYANLVANPDFTFHFKEQFSADLPARATPITDPAIRGTVFSHVLDQRRSNPGELDKWLKESPLVEVTFP